MKKQFFRVKQLADQTFLKAEKSEVLNHEELQIADQRVEALRSAINSINKKICPSGPTNDREKRLKKCLEYQLGATFIEESREEKECILFQHILKESGRIEHDLAKDYAEHESKVEEMVYSPLQKVIENEFPAILKHKHNLRKYCLDKDSASNRYHATKKETLKDDMEEADTKVEQSRDALAIEMFTLLARENEFSSYVLQLLKLQRGYHESALKNLETIIPQLERKIGDSHIKRVFGVPLQEHLRVTGKKLAYPLEVCITTLSEFGMTEEGLFRIAGGMSKVKRLKSAIDSGCFSTLIPEYRDVHVLASTLKLYLRELCEPLLTYQLHNEWMQSMQYPENQRLDVVRNLLNKLPQENRDNLAYLIQFLSKLTHHPENKMTSSNIAIVMAPNLLWNKNEEMDVNMGNCVTINMLVELFIKEVSTLFPDDVSRHVSAISFMPEEDLRSLNNGKTLEQFEAISMESILDSPRPNQRKRKPAAPVPPKSGHDCDDRSLSSVSSYPSGSSTLTRPHKAREPVKVKTASTNVEENDFSPLRKRSLSRDDLRSTAQNSLVIIDDDNTTKVVTQTVTGGQVTKTQPVPKPVIQNTTDVDKNFKTTATYHVGQYNEPSSGSNPKPIAAPRPSLQSEGDKVPKTTSARNCDDVMSKSQNSAEFSDVQLRRTEMLDRAKPEIPARPASLAPKRSSMPMDPQLHRTQCSVYSVANKQQPSIVNVQNRNEKFMLGHDTQMAEKEKFLGHQSKANVENKFADVNSNKESEVGAKPKDATDVKDAKPPPGPTVASRSNEKLNELNERLNGNQRASHTRTRSDGNLIELGARGGEVQTPPSPRSLSKPTEPPPPPPVVRKPEPESTNF